MLLVVLLAAVPKPAAARENLPSRTYLQIFTEKFGLDASSVPAPILEKLQQPAAKDIVTPSGVRWRATPRGLLEVLPSGAQKLWAAKEGLPVLNLTALAVGPDGWLWMGSRDGVISLRPDAPERERWFYFWGKRYLADNAVQNLAAEHHGAWIRTRSGLTHLQFKPFDLEQKSALFVARVQARHNRYGLVADCELTRADDPSSFRLASSDNDGLWTAIYAGAECFRYAVTKSPQALRNARQSLAALRRLVEITGIPGFPARSFIHKSDDRPAEGEWHWTPDGEWEWKGDTSSDELVGHFLACYLADELLPDEADRAAVRPVVERLATHLLDHGLNLVGYDGRVTTWGRYSTEYFQTPNGRADRALNSLEILSHLRVAYHLTRDEKFLRAYHRLIDEQGYLRNVTGFATETPVEVNYSDEELAFLSFYPLLRLEDDPRLRDQYLQALEGLWRRVEREHNPLWDFIYAVGMGAGTNYRKEEALDALQRIPLDTISWTVKNSQRVDLELDQSRGRFAERQAQRAIPPNERRVMKWNGNPFELDGGDEGRSEDDGAFFLLPYWLGRYHQCSDEGQVTRDEPKN